MSLNLNGLLRYLTDDTESRDTNKTALAELNHSYSSKSSRSFLFCLLLFFFLHRTFKWSKILLEKCNRMFIVGLAIPFYGEKQKWALQILQSSWLISSEPHQLVAHFNWLLFLLKKKKKRNCLLVCIFVMPTYTWTHLTINNLCSTVWNCSWPFGLDQIGWVGRA